MRHGTCENQAGKYIRSCCRYVNFAAEPMQGSLRQSENIEIFVWLSLDFLRDEKVRVG